MFSELGIYSFKTCARQRQESSGIQGAVTSMIATWNTCYMTDQRLRGFDADQGPGVVHLSSQVEHRGACGAYTDRPGGNKRIPLNCGPCGSSGGASRSMCGC